MNVAPRFEGPRSLVDHIEDYIMQGIILGRYRAGQKLTEKGLQTDLHVSRTPIREAFRLLEKEGFIQCLPRRGVFVRKLTKKDIEENLLVRANLEGLAARLATKHLTSQDLVALEEAMAGMVRAAEEKNFESYVECHDTFHRIFIQSSHNTLLIEILMNLRNHAFRHYLNYLYFRETYQDMTTVHQQILELLKSRNSEKVEELVRQHVLLAMEKFILFTPEDAAGMNVQGEVSRFE